MKTRQKALQWWAWVLHCACKWASCFHWSDMKSKGVHQRTLREGSHRGICSVRSWGLLPLVLESPNSKLAWRIRQCSHWALEHGPVVWYLLGINVNMPFFQVPMPEFDLSTNDQVQEWDFVFGHQSENWDPLRTCFALDPRQTTALHTHDSLLCLFSKKESDWVKRGKYVQSDMPDTSGENTTLFCAATQLLVLRHLVWTDPHF